MTTFTAGTVVTSDWLNTVDTFVADFPSQTGNNGKYLQTNGTSLSWDTVTGGGGGSLDGLEIMSVDNGYIVDPEGNTNCTSEVQRFFTACQSKKGYIPPGKYKITGPIYIYPNKTYHVEGAGYNIYGAAPSVWPGGTTFYNEGTNTSCFEIQNTNYANIDDQMVVLKDMTISGSQTSGVGIYLKNIHGFRGERLWVTTNGQAGMYAEDIWGCDFRNCVFTQNGQYGADLNNRCNAVSFYHCTFNSNSRVNGYGGFRSRASNGAGYENQAVVLNNCDFSYNGSNPWPMTSVTTAYDCVLQRIDGLTMNACYLEGFKTYSIYADSTTEAFTISNCTFTDCNVLIDNARNYTINNNLFWQVNTTCTFAVVGSGTSIRNSEKIEGNAYRGSVVKTFTGNAKERVEIFGTGIPTTGTWETGDIVWAKSPASGQNVGYHCIAGGTPGTWVTMIDGHDLDGNLVIRPASGANPVTVGMGKSGSYTNTVLGQDAGSAWTTSTNNVAVGYHSLNLATTAMSNTAVGYNTLSLVTTDGGGAGQGSQNTAIGSNALATCGAGYNNTAVGRNALTLLTTGYANVGVGNRAGDKISTGNSNIAFGNAALSGSTSGSANMAIGNSSLLYLTSGDGNVAVGNSALAYSDFGVTQLTTSSNGVGIGGATCGSGTGYVAIGYNSRAAADYSIAIGNGATSTASNAISIGNGVTNSTANTTVIGGASTTAFKPIGKVYLDSQNTISAAVAAPSTHKIEIVHNGVTYYLLASNV